MAANAVAHGLTAMQVSCANHAIPPFTGEGEGHSSVRVIRTIGAMAEARSLIIGMFLAGAREIAVMMHTDCGYCLAHERIDTITKPHLGKRDLVTLPGRSHPAPETDSP